MPGWLVDYLVAMVLVIRQLDGTVGPTDLIQDVLGARALIDGGSAYVPLNGPAVLAIGVVGPGWSHVSTHPPTSFLFALPLAHAPWSVASQVWAVAMLAVLFGSSWALGLGWPRMLLLFWPPVLSSLVTGVPILLFGASLAWRFRDRPLLSGTLLGVSALPKFATGLLLGFFVRRRQWRAVAGLILVWVLALLAIAMLNRGVLGEYVSAQIAGGEAKRQTARTDNGGLLPFAFAVAGVPGASVAVGLVAVAFLCAMRRTGEDEWSAWSWLSVAVLPVAWTYSLLLLVPGLFWSFRAGPIPTVLAIGALVAPFAGASAASNPVAVFCAIVLAGLAVIWPRSTDISWGHLSVARFPSGPRRWRLTHQLRPGR